MLLPPTTTGKCCAGKSGKERGLVLNTSRFCWVKEKGAKIRYAAPYNEEGSNVNFVKKLEETIFAVRTYERGVENETLSCGTGVTAVAIAMHYLGETNENLITLDTQGGKLQVSFTKDGDVYKNVNLIGPAIFVYKGTI